jgi:hypothetical protein
MNIARTSIITGPAIVTFGGQKFWSKGDVTVTFPQQRFALETAAFGRIDERIRDQRVVVSFEPAGRWTAALAAVLWPYASTAMGSSIFGSTDAALTVHGTDGQLLTVISAAITQMPTLRWGTNTTQVGPVQFTGLVGSNLDPSNQENLYTWTSSAFPGHAGFAVADIPVTAATVYWAFTESTPAIEALAEAGVEARFAATFGEHAVDGIGTVDMRLTSVTAGVTFIPVGTTAAALQDYEDGIARGQALYVSDLVIAPGNVGGCQCTLANAYLTDVQTRFGATSKRLGQVTFAASRDFTAYAVGPPEVPFAMNPLWTLALAD